MNLGEAIIRRNELVDKHLRNESLTSSEISELYRLDDVCKSNGSEKQVDI